jgi:hypothetical protein
MEHPTNRENKDLDSNEQKPKGVHLQSLRFVLTLDGVVVHVTHCDAGFSPDSGPGQQALNTTAVWYKPQGGEWARSPHRSAMKTCDVIKHSTLAELATKLV